MWWERRNEFVSRHMGQVKKRGEKLWKPNGDPTKRHLGLIAWAYTPDPAGVRRWLNQGSKGKKNPETRANPAHLNPTRKGSPDPYDPRDFQLQAQTARIFYDRLVEGKDPRRMSQAKVDELVGRAFAIATGSERKAPKPKTVKKRGKKVEVHKSSWIVPGTRKPTKRTATASKQRYEGTYTGSDGKRRTLTDLVHDRQAYELMLSMRRKKRTTQFYRVTREPTKAGDRYFVWPMPQGCRIPGPGLANYEQAAAIAADLNTRANPYQPAQWWRPPHPRSYPMKELAAWLPPASAFSMSYDPEAKAKKRKARRSRRTA
jgi:hypothetical protein